MIDIDRFAIVEVTPRFIECEGGKHFVLETRERKPTRLVRAGRHVKVGELFVANLMWEDSEDCFAEFEASALQLVRAHDLRDAREQLAKIRKTGMAKTITIRNHEGRETLGIGRVIAVQGRRTRLEPIHGEVPAWIDLPFFEHADPQIGDPLVVASSHAQPTRILVVESVRVARRWVASIQADGWPRDVIDAK